MKPSGKKSLPQPPALRNTTIPINGCPIGFGDINKENLPSIVRWLNERDFTWEITVNNIAYIQDTGTEQVLKARFDIPQRYRVI